MLLALYVYFALRQSNLIQPLKHAVCKHNVGFVFLADDTQLHLSAWPDSTEQPLFFFKDLNLPCMHGNKIKMLMLATKPT